MFFLLQFCQFTSGIIGESLQNALFRLLLEEDYIKDDSPPDVKT